jgi:hypothetical protein
MSTRRGRRATNAPRPELARQGQQQKKPAPQKQSGLEGTGIPEWRWRTTPVALAFAAGGLLGTYLGLSAALSDNLWAFISVQGVFALILGASAGRVIRRQLAIRKVEKLRSGT